MGLPAQLVHLPHFVPEPEDRLPASREDVLDTAQHPCFLFVGRLERPKGVQTLIPVFRRYGKAELLIAGTGSFEPQLRWLARGCANIHFLGQQSPGHVRALLRRAVALIVPSVCFEMFPNVTLEAFCQGTPAIVNNIGGLPEQIEESGAGFVYSGEGELIAAMDQLLADRAYRDHLGQLGYRAYQERWTADAYLSGYLGLIRNLIAPRRQLPEQVRGQSA